MDDRGLFTINQHRTFSVEEANALLPLIRKITQDWSQKVDALMARLEVIPTEQLELIQKIENEINDGIKSWHEKIRKLGVHPKGLWLVDFDSGDGFYCWKYPENRVTHWHSYADGYTSRVPVEQNL